MRATARERLLIALPLAAAAAAVQLAASTAAPDPRPAALPDAPIRCKAGTVRAVILGKQRCLRVGARCLRRYDRSYHRYGFHCHGPRLSRPPRPAPPQPAPPTPPAPSPRPDAPAGTISFTGYPSDAIYAHWDDVPPLPRPAYAESPPVGGIHTVYWARCRFFEEPVDDGMTVHSLEHGAVWLAYRPDLPAADRAVLRGFVDGTHEILASPYAGISEPVVAVAWARQLRLDSVRDPRLSQFIDAFHDAPHSPQAFIHTCTSPVG